MFLIFGVISSSELVLLKLLYLEYWCVDLFICTVVGCLGLQGYGPGHSCLRMLAYFCWLNFEDVNKFWGANYVSFDWTCRIQMTISMLVTLNGVVQSHNIFPLYVLLARLVSNIGVLEVRMHLFLFPSQIDIY
jgi:hypothetical protein